MPSVGCSSQGYRLLKLICVCILERYNIAICGFSSFMKNCIKFSRDNFYEENISARLRPRLYMIQKQLSAYSSKHVIASAAC